VVQWTAVRGQPLDSARPGCLDIKPAGISASSDAHDPYHRDDLAGLLKRRARELGILFKEVVNRTIRAGLGEPAKARQGAVPRTLPHSFGLKPGIDLDKLGQLADELEAETSAASLERSHDPPRPRRSRKNLRRPLR
jgi:hypothetical protein